MHESEICAETFNVDSQYKNFIDNVSFFFHETCGQI